ncbi:MAG TPA: family 43 glycosylhydrolase [Terriglobales bacterium]|nr:family 43 glycosylhydrolase [Terriglobales bacterium]
MSRSLAALFASFFLAVLLGCGGRAAPNVAASLASVTASGASEYSNPLRITTGSGSVVESCPDPAIIRGQKPGDDLWYMYCTEDRFQDGGRLHYIAISASRDLVTWSYVGDVFSDRPSWVSDDGYVWAPDVQFFNGRYYLYYAASDTKLGGSAIFVATSDSPLGPWSAASTPVVPPSSPRWTIDPFVAEDGGQRYIFFGSFVGGISARALSADGMTSSPSETPIAVADRYEAAYIVRHDGYFYLFVSAGACCNGPLSGYGVFAARSQNLLGPYLDRDGNSLLEPRVGGTPVLAMNGNRWIGPGHNSMVTDAAGQDWMLYHAISAEKPYFSGSWTRRPAMLDRVDWIDGWPRVRGGAGPSDSPQTAPFMAPASQLPVATAAPSDIPAAIVSAASDDFSAFALAPNWSWIRPPAPGSYGLDSEGFRFDTQAGQIYVNQNNASVLVEAAPAGDYIVETRISTTVPTVGAFNYAQAGLLIYKDDANYVKLASVAINQTRQLEFAKQLNGVPSGSPQYGSALLASPADFTWLRIARRATANGETYTSYSSHDGIRWEGGATWTHTLGGNVKIGLVSMAGAGFTAHFSYVRVYSLN